jgi:predicted negative regulator of RcsB-dependent stress response
VDETASVWPAGFPMDHIAIYMGWYTENVAGPFAQPLVEFMPGAFAYHLHSYSAASLRTTTNNWVGPLLGKGATCAMGAVDEPYLRGTPEVRVFAGRWLYNGFTFGEAACAAQPVLSWQTTVVGDPLYRPFSKPPLQLQAELQYRRSKLLEWSTLRLVNLALVGGANQANLTISLEDDPITKESAVLTAKLGDFYTAQGKPASAIAAYLRALLLAPSPAQRLSLRLTLGEKFLAENRTEEARQNYEQLLFEAPDYPDGPLIRSRLDSLTAKPTK